MSEASKRTELLIDRLRGIYTLPVNDGAGLLDGKDTFTRTFPVAPIQVEAAILIADLASSRACPSPLPRDFEHHQHNSHSDQSGGYAVEGGAEVHRSVLS